ncbi:MAG: hypothetical protein AAF533_03515 [Acidobacteriota bacterium]
MTSSPMSPRDLFALGSALLAAVLVAAVVLHLLRGGSLSELESPRSPDRPADRDETADPSEDPPHPT